MKTRIAAPEYGGAFHAEANTQLRFVLPGELVEAAPLTILDPSPERVPPNVACDLADRAPLPPRMRAP